MKQGILTSIQIASIIVNEQVRHLFNDYAQMELTKDVHKKGILQPVVINEKAGKYHLVCGERRYRANQKVIEGFSYTDEATGKKITVPGDKKRDMLPANVFKDLTDDEVLDMQIAENLHRKDVHPMEEAAAYKKMQVVHKFDIKEIAHRVGMTEKYVGMRMKLNDLSAANQKLFFHGKMSMTDALKLCKFSDVVQAEIIKNSNSYGGDIKVSQYAVDNAMKDLTKAPFSTKDPELVKAAGACTTCQHNTAANTLLFPEEGGKSRCMNGKCFELKTQMSFTKKFEEARLDPQTVFISSSWYINNLNPIVKKAGVKVLNYEQYTVVSSPKQKDIDAGKVKKAFYVNGDQIGRSTHVTLKKEKTSSSSSAAKPSVAAFKEKKSAGKVTAVDIDSEIKRINDAETRKKELDLEKEWPEIHKLLNEDLKFLNNTKPLSVNEKIALVIVLQDECGMFTNNAEYSKNDFDASEVLDKLGCKAYHEEVEMVEWLMKNEKKLDDIIAQFMRILIIDKITPNAFAVQKSQQRCVEMILSGYQPAAVKKIKDATAEEQAKRKEKIDKTIAALKESKKNLTDKKAAPAKGKALGKGLSALLTDAKKKKK